MSDFLIVFLFFVLVLVIAFLLSERFFLVRAHKESQDKLLEELSRATKAVISKNANEYVMTTSIDKVAPEKAPPVESDLVSEESLSDEEFFDTIKPKES